MCYNIKKIKILFVIKDMKCMKVIPFDELYYSEFIICEPFSKEQNWFSRNNIYYSLNRPKPSHTLLWFKNCNARITDSLGNVVNVKQNQMTYMSKGIEYYIDFFNTAPDQADTLVIHFQLKDMHNNDIAPTTIPEIVIENVDVSLALKLQKLSDEFKKNIVCIPDATSLIYKLLALICASRRSDNTKNRYYCIKEGIELLENDANISIKEIARICGVSECYFRRLFKEYSGESPMDFKQKHRIEKAKQLLLSDTLTINDIAQDLHFSDIYHFSKTFKNITGISPRRFIDINR